MATLPVNPDDHPIVRIVKQQEPFLPRKALAVLLVYALQRLQRCGGDLWMGQFGQDFASFRLRLGKRRASEKAIDAWMLQVLSELERSDAPTRPRGGKKLAWPPRIAYAKYRFALKSVEVAQKELRAQEKTPGILGRKITALWRGRVREILLDTSLFSPALGPRGARRAPRLADHKNC